MNTATIALSAHRLVSSTSFFVILKLVALTPLLATSQTALAGNAAQNYNCTPSLQLRPTCDALLSVQLDPSTIPVPVFSDHSIDVINGNAYQFELDYKSMASGFELTRHYNSSLTDGKHGLGAGWSHNFAMSLSRVSDTQVDIAQANGRVISFHRATNAPSKTDSKVPESILHTAQSGYDGYLEAGEVTIWHLPDGRKLFFNDVSEHERSKLQKVDFGDHLGVLELTYNDNRLHRVTDRRGDSLTFNYEPGAVSPSVSKPGNTAVSTSLITSITMPNGQRIVYSYDSVANLVSVVYPDESSIDYKYENENLPNHLTKRQSANNGRLSEWLYDNAGRAIEWSADNGKDTWTIERTFASQGTANQPLEKAADSMNNATAAATGTAIVIGANNHRTHYSWNYHIENGTTHTITNIDCGNCQQEHLPKHGSQEYKQMVQALASQHLSSFFKLGDSVPSLWESLEYHTNPENSESGKSVFIGEYPHPEGNLPIQITANRIGEIVDIKYQGGSFLKAALRTTQEQTQRCYESRQLRDIHTVVRDRLKALGTDNDGCQEDFALYLQLKKELELQVKPVDF